MALPEYEGYSSGEVVGAAAAEHGPPAPVPASDYLSGACTLSHQSSLVHISVLSSTAQLVTSVSGSPSLNSISRATVQGAQDTFSFEPREPVLSQHGGNPTDSQLVSIVPNSEGERQSYPSISLSSLQSSTVTSVSYQETGSGEGDHAIRGGANATQLPCQHTPASYQQRGSRGHTSGYASQNADYESPLSRNIQGAVSSSSRAIKLTEPAIHGLIVRSGSNKDPCFRQFHSLQSRINSFPRAFRLDGVLVNRDTLAKAGFFYSGQDGQESVTCYHCGCSPRVWRDGQEPFTEHRHLSPYCRALPRI